MCSHSTHTKCDCAQLISGDKWSPDAYSDEYHTATGYLLSWSLLIELFTAATPTVRRHPAFVPR